MKRCKHIQKKLTHYIEQELDQFEKDQVESHLQNCGKCRQELAGLTKLSAKLTPESYDLPATYSSELIVKLNDRLGQPKILQRRLVPSISLIFAGLLVALTVIFFNGKTENIFTQDYLLYQTYGGEHLLYDINSVELDTELDVSVMPDNYFTLSREYLLETAKNYKSENIDEVFADLDDETFKQIIKNIESTEL
ncbi:MAG: anti-sigma factor family protein [Fidelibacterota bacterium]